MLDRDDYLMFSELPKGITIKDFTFSIEFLDNPKSKLINCYSHVNVCEEPGEVDTSCGRKIKLNVLINDDTVRNPIRLTLWGCHVSKVATGSFGSKS